MVSLGSAGWEPLLLRVAAAVGSGRHLEVVRSTGVGSVLHSVGMVATAAVR